MVIEFHRIACYVIDREKRLPPITCIGSDLGQPSLGQPIPERAPSLIVLAVRPSYKLRCIVGCELVDMAISTNPKPTIYRNL